MNCPNCNAYLPDKQEFVCKDNPLLDAIFVYKGKAYSSMMIDKRYLIGKVKFEDGIYKVIKKDTNIL